MKTTFHFHLWTSLGCVNEAKTGGLTSYRFHVTHLTCLRLEKKKNEKKNCFNPIVCYDDWIVIVWRVSPNRLHSRRIVLIFQSRRDLLMFFDDQEGGGKVPSLPVHPECNKSWLLKPERFSILGMVFSCHLHRV